jgi:hypothetical protein
VVDPPDEVELDDEVDPVVVAPVELTPELELPVLPLVVEPVPFPVEVPDVPVPFVLTRGALAVEHARTRPSDHPQSQRMAQLYHPAKARTCD